MTCTCPNRAVLAAAGLLLAVAAGLLITAAAGCAPVPNPPGGPPAPTATAATPPAPLADEQGQALLDEYTTRLRTLAGDDATTSPLAPPPHAGWARTLTPADGSALHSPTEILIFPTVGERDAYRWTAGQTPAGSGCWAIAAGVDLWAVRIVDAPTNCADADLIAAHLGGELFPELPASAPETAARTPLVV
ncbi:hypothetical protein [Parafrankia discariae]|uniref:hypothetical protein n=1 Tax=Parafrankia discariae TaxID=365528 RepID=UPI000376BA86|nr:hypothetical protein [Parafrankia discariae]